MISVFLGKIDFATSYNELLLKYGERVKKILFKVLASKMAMIIDF